jgi:hypothetical protein
VKIYVAAVEALRNKERGGQKRMKLTSPRQNNGAFLSFTPIERLLYFFAGFFFWNLTQVWTKLRVLVLCFPDFTENSIIPFFFFGG